MSGLAQAAARPGAHAADTVGADSAAELLVRPGGVADADGANVGGDPLEELHSGDGPGGRQHDRWHHVVTFAEEHCEYAVQPTAGEHLPVVASVRGAGSPGDHRSAGDRVARWATWRCGHRSPRLLGRGPPRRGLSALRVSRRALVTDLGAASAWCWCVRSSGYGEGP